MTLNYKQSRGMAIPTCERLHSIFHLNLGKALMGKSQLEQAEAECREALRLNPGLAEAHNNLGAVLRARGRMDEAIAECRKAVRLRPGYAEAHNNLGAALASKGRL